MPRSRVRYVVPSGKKRCSQCHQIFGPEDMNGGLCRGCYRVYHRNWSREARTEILNELMDEAMAHYGKTCRYCGEDDRSVLVILPRQGKGVRAMLYNLRASEWPKGYYMACANCEIKEKRGELQNS